MRQNASPVVLIHGALCDARIWKGQVEALSAAGFEAMALDLEGYRPDIFDPSRFSAERHCKAIAAFLSGLQRPAHLVGHSRGARLALNVAARAPQSCASLTLIEAGGVSEAGFFGDGGSAPIQHGPSPAVAALIHLDQGDTEAALRTFVDAGDGKNAWAKAPGEFKTLAMQNAETLRAMAVDRTAPLTRQAAREVHCPTLLLEGALSLGIFHRIADVLQSILADARRVRIPDANHFLPITAEAAVSAALGSFVLSLSSEPVA